jgi:hypothetical protein
LKLIDEGEEMTAVITEAQRFEMHTCLRGLMGEEVANTMMEHLPPSGWSDVVRKADLDQVQVALKSDIALVRGDLGQGKAALKSDIEQLHKDVARVESSLKADIKGLRIAIGALIPTMVAGFIGLYSALVSKL